MGQLKKNCNYHKIPKKLPRIAYPPRSYFSADLTNPCRFLKKNFENQNWPSICLKFIPEELIIFLGVKLTFFTVSYFSNYSYDWLCQRMLISDAKFTFQADRKCLAGPGLLAGRTRVEEVEEEEGGAGGGHFGEKKYCRLDLVLSPEIF